MTNSWYTKERVVIIYPSFNWHLGSRVIASSVRPLLISTHNHMHYLPLPVNYKPVPSPRSSSSCNLGCKNQDSSTSGWASRPANTNLLQKWKHAKGGCSLYVNLLVVAVWWFQARFLVFIWKGISIDFVCAGKGRAGNYFGHVAKKAKRVFIISTLERHYYSVAMRGNRWRMLL